MASCAVWLGAAVWIKMDLAARQSGHDVRPSHPAKVAVALLMVTACGKSSDVPDEPPMSRECVALPTSKWGAVQNAQKALIIRGLDYRGRLEVTAPDVLKRITACFREPRPVRENDFRIGITSFTIGFVMSDGSRIWVVTGGSVFETTESGAAGMSDEDESIPPIWKGGSAGAVKIGNLDRSLEGYLRELFSR